jgi:aspartate carbamoyltransferase catalytic subunit
MKQMKQTAVLMHPLPRVSEIAESTDADPRAIYFSEQIPNGVYVRMALLSWILT